MYIQSVLSFLSWYFLFASTGYSCRYLKKGVASSYDRSGRPDYHRKVTIQRCRFYPFIRHNLIPAASTQAQWTVSHNACWGYYSRYDNIQSVWRQAVNSGFHKFPFQITLHVIRRDKNGTMPLVWHHITHQGFRRYLEHTLPSNGSYTLLQLNLNPQNDFDPCRTGAFSQSQHSERLESWS